MKIGNIYLCSVPMDMSYSKVLDFINYKPFTDKLNETGLTYEGKIKQLRYIMSSVIGSTYGFITTINNQSIRSSKTVDCDMEITIPFTADYLNNIGVNYIIITTNRAVQGGELDFRFYFVDTIESENDGDNPSSTLFLKYDVWTNNYPKLCIERSNQKIIKRHKDERFLIDGKIGFNYFNKISSNAPIKRNIKPLTFNNDMQLLFIKITFKSLDNVKVKVKGFATNDNTLEEITPIPLLDDLYFTNVMYCPIALFNEFELTQCYFHFPPQNITEGVTSISWNFTPSAIGGLSISSFICNNKITDYIDKIEFTYNAPINYSVGYDYQSLKYRVSMQGVFFSINLGGEDIPCICNANVGISGDTDLLKNYIYSNLIYSSLYKSTVVSSKMVEYNASISVLSNTFIVNHDMSPVALSYPLYYKSIIYNNEEKIIPKMYSSDANFDVSISHRQKAPLLKITDEESGEMVFGVGEYLKSNGVLSFSTSASDIFANRNGAQFKTEMDIKKLQLISAVGEALPTPMKTIASAKYINKVKKGVKQLAEGVGSNLYKELIGMDIYTTHLQQKAVKEDLATTPPNYYSNSGEDDIIYQDRVLISENTCTDSVLSEGLINEHYLEGCNVVEIDDIVTNYRVSFDYLKTLDCKLNIRNISNSDREKLEDILNSGLTKIHISSIYSANGSVRKTKNPVFNLNIDTVNNLEYKFFSNQEYINSIGEINI